MTWAGPADTPTSARATALAPSLPPSERRVVDAIVADPAAVVDATAQEFADAIGVGRATVIRTAQRLGYDGYPQLRIGLARELALAPRPIGDDSPGGVVRARIEQFGAAVGKLSGAVDDAAVAEFVSVLDRAARVVVVATGLSSPAGLDVAMRLSTLGRPAEFLADTLAQQIAASNLDDGSACLVISGSGATRTSLDAAAAARAAGATVLAITSFARAPLLTHAHTALVVPPLRESFADELLHTSRVGLALVLESLIEALAVARGDSGAAARSRALPLIEKRISI